MAQVLVQKALSEKQELQQQPEGVVGPKDSSPSSLEGGAWLTSVCLTPCVPEASYACSLPISTCFSCKSRETRGHVPRHIPREVARWEGKFRPHPALAHTTSLSSDMIFPVLSLSLLICKEGW